MSTLTSIIFNYDLELRKMRQWIKELTLATPDRRPEKMRVLDVGCGYGRHLRWLVKEGYDATGVDVSERVVAENVKAGFPCLTPSQFKGRSTQYDLIVMSHIIEHFTPDALLVFLTEYLAFLRPGGHLLIATPVGGNYFYDDFDHVKPYHPAGLLMVFGENGGGQIQYTSPIRLELEKLWYKRTYFCLHHLAGRRVKCASTPWIKLMDLVSGIIFRLSGGLLGRTVGWAAVYRKS